MSTPVTAGADATASFSCDDDTLEEEAAAEVSEELLWPNLPASVRTVSKLRQFFDGLLRNLDTLFLRALSPLPLLARLSWLAKSA